jgi:hypothetical protein
MVSIARYEALAAVRHAGRRRPLAAPVEGPLVPRADARGAARGRRRP